MKMMMQGFTTSFQKTNRFVANLSLSEFLWPPIIIYLTAATNMSIANGTSTYLLIYVFLFLCPGMALGRLLKIQDPIVELTLAIGLSIALNTILSIIIILLNIGTILTGFYTLAVISLLGSGIQIIKWFFHQSPAPQKEDA